MAQIRDENEGRTICLDTQFAMKECFFHPPSRMPNINQIITYLWHEDYNVDTDGDSSDPFSTEWTDFWCRSRLDPTIEFEICREGELWRVSASHNELKNRIGLLVVHTGTSVFEDRELTQKVSVETMLKNCGDFSLDAAMARMVSLEAK